MHKYFLRFAPYIIGFMILALHFIGFLISCIFPRYSVFSWSGVATIDLCFGYNCGKLVHNLHENMFKDALTGISNRGFLYFKATNLMDKLSKEKKDISILVIDIDNLKSINDNSGHLAGDYLVKHISNILRENIRKNDNVIRWGGDEFVVTMPATNTDTAYEMAEGIRKNIADSELDFESIKIKATVSIGIATINKKMDLDAFVDMADQALYKAKQFRNAVKV
jgi:diguanylate cyclase